MVGLCVFVGDGVVVVGGCNIIRGILSLRAGGGEVFELRREAANHKATKMESRKSGQHTKAVAALTLSSKAFTTMWPLPVFGCS